jgi:hypothetical protein
VLKDNGYSTGAFVSGGWANKLHGYHKGFDEFHHLFDISLFLQNFVTFDINYFANLYSAGAIQFEQIYNRLFPLLIDTFSFLLDFCTEKNKELKTKSIPTSPVFHDWDFTQLQKIISIEKQTFQSNPRLYIESLLSPEKNSYIFGKLPGSKSDPAKASGGYVMNALTQWIAHQKKRPFFAWGHLMDIHDGNFTTHDILRPKATIQQEMIRTLDIHTKILIKGKSYISNNLYDYSLAYVDQQIGNLVNFLSRQKILDNTMLVIVSDHGSRGGGAPKRAVCDIVETYDELLHVPMAFIHSAITPKVISDLHSILDLAPTLLDLLGISVPATFKGTPIKQKRTQGNDYILMENLGRGPCDFTSKPINIGVRTDKYKLNFQDSFHNNKMGGVIKGFYDLGNDPHEMHDCKDDSKYQDIIKTLAEIALNRCREIRRENSTNADVINSSIPKDAVYS